ncbi:pentapeptide repeat-containing protein [Streptomyces venezuelae ATCC 10712]|nr:pentapeptide repeat-containing protein [Streptomyces venezuelae ATCC 10712]
MRSATPSPPSHHPCPASPGQARRRPVGCHGDMTEDRSRLRRDGPRPRATEGRRHTSRTSPWLIAGSLLPGLAAVVALTLTWKEGTDTLKQGNAELRVAEQGQITERFTAAIEQLGEDDEELTFGGVYALERIMEDSARDQPRIVSVLSAFVRSHAPVPAGGFAAHKAGAAPPTLPPPVVAVIGVLADRPPGRDGSAVVDWSDSDLRGLRLAVGSQVPGGPPKVPRFPFGGSRLKNSDLRDARFTAVDLSRAFLDGARLAGAELTRVDLTGADLTGVDAEGAHVRDSVLKGAVLRGAKLPKADFVRTDLTGAYLQEAQLPGARFSSVEDFSSVAEGGRLAGAHLDDADLTGSFLFRADLTGAELRNADLTGAQLGGANLCNAVLNNAQLSFPPDLPEGRAKTGANLTRADLRHADLSHANLAGALLTGADLRGADLLGTDLTGATLAGADLTGVDLSGAVGLPPDAERGEPLPPPESRRPCPARPPVAGAG